MLKIKVGAEFLELPPDMELTINGENPILAEDRIPMTNSYPTEIDPSKKNLRILHHPNRITASDVPDEQSSEIIFGERVIERGVFVTEESGETLQGYFKGIDTNKNFETLMNELELNFRPDSSDFDDAYCRAANAAGGPLLFAPVRLYGDVQRDAPLTEWRTYLNYYTANDHFLRDFMPALRVDWLLDKIMGENLKDNPFRSGVLSRLVVQTLQRKDWEYPNTLKYSRLQDYLPKTETSQFIKDLLNLFCASIVIRNNEYSIVFNKNMFNTADRVDWSDKLITPYTLIRTKGKNYVYGYADAKDGTLGDGGRSASNFLTLRNLETETSPDAQKFSITSSGQIVERIRNNELESRWQYNIINSGFGEGTGKKKDDYDITSNMRPMDMSWNSIPAASDNLLTKYRIFCPQVDLGDLNADKMLRIMMWTGDVEAGGVKYPFMSPYSTHPNSAQGEFPFDLTWSGAKGLINSFHKEFKAWIERDKLELHGQMLWTVDDLRNISYLRKYHIHGRDFFLKNFSAPLTVRRIMPVEVEFVEV